MNEHYAFHEILRVTEEAGERLFRELMKRKLEGMVAKRSDSVYVSGRTRAWLKIKTKAGRGEMRIRSGTWGHPPA